jgi:hypothetical protein
MRSTRLIAVTDEYDNTPGLAIKGTPTQMEEFMADREGTLIAHDILEHQNGAGEIGSVWDELEALGGLWQVRGRHGDMCELKHRSFWSPAQNVASDVSRMFGDWIDHQYCGPGGLSAGGRRHDYDDEFREIVEYARESIRAEYTDMGNGSPGEDENGWSPDLYEALDTYLALVPRRMRIGFRKAARRFGRDPYGGISMFKEIQRAVGTASIEFEGQEFVLTYGRQQAILRELPGDW